MPMALLFRALRPAAVICASQVALAALVPLPAAVAEVLAVQCTIDSYRSSYAPRPETFTVQVDLDAGTLITYYGTLPLKLGRRELRGVGIVDGGWRASVVIDRRSGRMEAGTDKVDGRKYSYVDLKGQCILPPELQGAGYKPAS